jgi:anhydro-N-acetylmuramic acid kinase
MDDKKYFIGLMSGTSCDGTDAALIQTQGRKIKLIATHYQAFPNALREKVYALCEPGYNAIERLGECDYQLGSCYANAVSELLRKTSLTAKDIEAIGCHGQTIRHRPNASTPFTLQIGDPNRIVALTGIDTVSDFRRRDVVLGGQGAPLMPAFHAALLPIKKRPAWVINIGGMANVTHLLPQRNQSISGHDIGPGNVLLDTHYQRHHHNHFDNKGEWARSGSINRVLLKQMLNDDYFAKPAPKSTGREYFNGEWLNQQLKLHRQTKAEDIQRTLVELTVQTIVQTVGDNDAPAWICGGGAFNDLLMECLQHQLPGSVADTSELGIAPEWVEAAGFAWLAAQTILNKTANIPAVTGARSRSTLGAIWRATE